MTKPTYKTPAQVKQSFLKAVWMSTKDTSLVKECSKLYDGSK